MPTYEYRCPEGHEFERFFRKISDSIAELPCPQCGKVATRQLTGGAGLVFKGSGFYLTDYGKNAHRTSGPESGGTGKSGGDGGSSGSSGSSGGGGGGGEKGGSDSGASTSAGSSESKSTGDSSSAKSGDAKPAGPSSPAKSPKSDS